MSFKIVADESVDFRIVVQLRKIGFQVYAISEEQYSIKDETVLAIAVEQNSLLITEDKDFGELVFRLQFRHCGILLVRIEDPNQKIEVTAKAISSNYSDLKDRFSVLSKSKLRIKA
jgi:predicted nuclease of predicted toxin-antitoxin system